ncbi:MAG: YraN family protein [Bacteroidales bacterium]|jgi:putative endonuclease|nr:YraN family protein [Bacteroidales bacterium]
MNDEKTEKNHIYFGKQGENLAINYLLSKGLQIIERNFVFGKNEIDIICRDRNEIVFVEVKTRTTNIFGEPEMAVNIQKQRSIIKVADAYICKYNIDLESRFDIISIVIDKENKSQIHHIERAFTPFI